MTANRKSHLDIALRSLVLPGWGQITLARRRGIFLLIVYGFLFSLLIVLIFFPWEKMLSVLIVLPMFLLVWHLGVVLDAYLCGMQSFQDNHFLESRLAGIRNFVLGLMIFNIPLLLGNYVTQNIAQIFRISSDSMKPNFLKKDFFLINKVIYKSAKPQRGDTLVFRDPQDPERLVVKRLLGLGGDVLEIKEGRIYVNAQPLGLPSIKGIHYLNKGPYGEAGQKVFIPSSYYYVLGDNSQSSLDSRFWGFVPKNQVFGKAMRFP